MKNSQNKAEELASDLYSRQVGLYGFDTMKKIMKLNIFIYGMRGLGIEIAKNIILAGPNKVTIFDPNITKMYLTSSFFSISLFHLIIKLHQRLIYLLIWC